ncbi:tetratricopeptide repeat-containing sensor histidine kinase [Fulvivirga lutimaris]|uniref:tetratricopeptide repeat-containing sensor histidine kinase n=1 Tax=Fulvivirga lutimaris TaxID=1819566 RepID=UPI0012BC60F6|nr:tetratricopeptide repeat-containing sensor histidine kinase [Fulvivirga lutimaris]MTI41916.1 tetratricopeptide repeat protein [Fulvivirga lutimaris]
MKILGILFSFILSFSSYVSHSQSNPLYSLEQRVLNTTGKEKIDAINALAFRQTLGDFELSKPSLEEAISLSEKENYIKGLAEAYTYKGVYENLNGNKEAGIKLLLKGAELGHEIQEYGVEGYALLQAGTIYLNLGLNDSAKYWYDKSYTALKDSTSSIQFSILYLQMSQYYGLISKPKLELSYLLLTLHIREELEDKFLLADVYVQLSKWYIKRSNANTAHEYLKKAEALNISENFTTLWKDIKYHKAIILLNQSSFNEALVFIEDVKQYHLNNDDIQQYVKFLLDFSETLETLDYYDLSLKNGLEALQIAVENEYAREKVRAQLIISRNYYRILQSSLAHEFTDQALLEAKNNNFTEEEGNAYNLKGLLLQAENKQKEALINFENALAIRTTLGNKQDISSTLSNMGEIYEDFGQIQKALELQEESLIMSEEVLDYYGVCWSSKGVGSLYMKLKDYKNAKYYLDKAEETAKSIKAGNILIYIYQKQRDLLIEQRQLNEALQYTLLYDELKDSVNSAAITNRILSLRNIYEIEMKNQEIELLNKDKQVKEDQLFIQNSLIQKQRFLIAATVIGLLLLSILAFTLFTYFRKKAALSKELQERNEEIQTQAEELSESNSSLQELNKVLSEKQQEIHAQSEELIRSNQIVSNQNEKLKLMHDEVVTQNEELQQSQDEIVQQRDKLTEQNKQLEKAKRIIEKQHKEIKLQNENLEKDVEKRTEELVKYNQQLEQFAFISSHNLRAPVARILGLGQLLEFDNESAENRSYIHENLISSTRELDRVVKDLNTILEINKNNSSVITPIDLEEELKLILVNLENELKETETKINVDFSNAKIVNAIRPYFDSILINLIGNAIKYRHPNRTPKIQITTKKADGFIRLMVKDNGLGIDLDLFREKLFTLYSRFHSHVEGKGLGLYLVKTQVVAMGGMIEVESEVDKGTTFYVYFKA